MQKHGASYSNKMNNDDFKQNGILQHSLFIDRNPLEHQRRHNMLYSFFTELVNDYIHATNRQIDRSTISELAEWARRQAKSPD